MNLLKNELYKLLKMKKIYIFAVVMLGITLLNLYDYHPGGSERTVWDFQYGQSVPLTMIQIFSQFMIIFIPIVVADSISNEYRNGTLKLSLLRPVKRGNLLLAKIMALFIFIVVSTVIFLIQSYIMGVYFVGWGEATEYMGTTYTPLKGIGLTITIYTLFMLPALAYGIVAGFIAVLAKNMSTAIIISLVVITIGLNLNDITAIAPYSLAHHLMYFPEELMQAERWTGILPNVGMVLIYMIVFAGLSFWAFKKKEILY
ncbi:ABC transporter permease [Oceanobacillus jeddahense]|uniref:ABC transporter permease n=1 Tax=Oceanobacillus jeddahense TaxID=1462527 RepID=A0ABY5JRG4_9BACI|nr:ABC transporter permease [Oceanobacillus jeddahense]UUI01209.1 ABC transporter permease [Oceanobacillus jeddahense]